MGSVRRSDEHFASQFNALPFSLRWLPWRRFTACYGTMEPWNEWRYYCAGKSLLTHFLMEHLVQSGNQKKKTRFTGLFFLTPGQCPPSKSVTLRQLEEQFYLFIQTPLDRRGMASLQSNSTFTFNTTWQASLLGICILYVRPL